MKNCISRSRAFVVVFCLLLPSSLLAGWFPSGRLTFNSANSTTSENHAWCVAGDDSGNMHAVWEDRRDGNAEVYYKFYDGATWSQDLRLSALPYDSQTPSIAAGDTGEVHVVWIDRRDGFKEVYYKKYDGAAWCPDTRLTVSTGDARDVSMCAEGDYVHVVWVDYRTGYSEVYYKLYDGGVWQADERLTVVTGISFSPSVAADDSGRVHVVWYDYRGHRGIYYMYFDGVAWSAEEHISSSSLFAVNPSICLDDGGHVHVVWYDDRDGDYEIYHREHDGVAWLADERLTYDEGMSYNPSVAVDGTGDVHVVWHDYRTGQFEVYHKVFDGVSWSADRLLSDPAHSSQDASVGGAGNDVGVIWYDNLGGNGEIYWTRTFEGPFDAPQAFAVYPDSARTGDVIEDLYITGNGFMFPDSVWLELEGEPRIFAENIVVTSPESIVCRIVLDWAHYGLWDVVVRNPDGQTAVLDSAFRITPLPEGPYVSYVYPDSAFAGTFSRNITLVGGRLSDSASVRLIRTGEPDVSSYDVVVDSDEVLRFKLDLVGAGPGFWDIVLSNPDGQEDTLYSGFKVLLGWSEPVRLTYDPSDSRNTYPDARSIAAGTGGMLHVVWHDLRHSQPEVYYRRYNGSAWDMEERLTESGGSAEEAAVAADAYSNVHVVWVDSRDGNREIYYMKHDGASWGPETRLTDMADDSYRPAVAAGTGGEVHVAWCDERDGSAEIYYKKFDGLAWGADLNLSNDSRGCTEPSIAVDGLGRVHVAWVAGSTAMDVQYRMHDGAWGGVTTLSDAWQHVRTPCVEATASGRVYVVWREELTLGVHDIFIREHNGVSWLPAGKVTYMGACGRSSVVADADGNIHLAWRFIDGSDYNVYYKMSDGWNWSEHGAITDVGGISDNPSLALDADGGVHMVWEDNRDGHYDIYYAYRVPPQTAAVAEGEAMSREDLQISVSPNPVVGRTVLRFTVGSRAAARLSVYDIQGRAVWEHDTGVLEPGRYSVGWERSDMQGENVCPGIYFAVVETGQTRATAKLVVLR